MTSDVELRPMVLTAKQAGRLLSLSEREIRRLAKCEEALRRIASLTIVETSHGARLIAEAALSPKDPTQ